MENAKLNVLSILHLLGEELKLYELMKNEKEALSEIIINLAVEIKRYEYVDYYLRQGFKPKKLLPKIDDYLPKEEVFDLFSIINKIILKI